MLGLLAQKPKAYRVSDDRVYHVYNQWEAITNIGTFEYGLVDDRKLTLEDEWFIRFLRKHFPNNKNRINFFGPLSTPFLMNKKMPGVKVFYTPEDVDKPFIKLNLFYGNYGLNCVDFAMGFKRMIKEKYLRVPYWLIRTFSPELDEEGIIERIDEINKRKYKKNEACALICSHDKKGTREMILKDVQNVIPVSIAGRWHNNTTELLNEYKNNKYEYLKKFKFNICAENDNTKDYVTEKLPEAFMAGAVPIYYGSDNNPEPGIFNHDAVIFWNKDGDNNKNLELIKLLNHNYKAYDEFVSQSRFLPESKEYVIDIYRGIKDNFTRILS